MNEGISLEVQDLEVRYGGIRAVQGISFSVNPGEIVAMIGANGAGKSSTLRAIAEAEAATSGGLRLNLNVAVSYGGRAEIAYTPMQYQRDADTLRFKVSENGFEIGASLRAELRQGAFTGVYGMAGPLASFRALCGSSGRFDQNGRVVCDEGATSRIGYALGVGYRWQSSQTRDMSFEVRYLDNVTAAQGGSLLTVSIGIRGRTRNAND
jgi:energy-coupling factor transporter ATP-binding protein EcfA2